MPPRLRTPYICRRCLLARRKYTTPATSSTSDPPLPHASGAVQLRSRRLLVLHGRDTAEFLHGITTANMRTSATTGLYSAFLNAQGRMLNEVFIYPASHAEAYRERLPAKLSADDPAYFIEVDAGQVELLQKHLKRYKLRAKVDVRAVDEGEWTVWSSWWAGAPWTAHSSAPSEDGRIGCVDSRAPGMGQRLLLPGGTSDELITSVEESTEEAYKLRRMLKGVAEGQEEIAREASLPHECNVDFMGGIDFKKGCYVGQELTIRTQHTGVVRKRILPVVLYGPGEAMPEKLEYRPDSAIPQPDNRSNIMPEAKVGRSVGKYLDGVGNIGLALCRIEKMTDLVLTAEGTGWTTEDEFRIAGAEGANETKIKAFVPDWVRNNIKVRDPQMRAA